MSLKSEYQTYQINEIFTDYSGPADKALARMNHCSCCGAKLLLSHLSDYKSLIVQETSRCLDCGKDNRKIIHVLN